MFAELVWRLLGRGAAWFGESVWFGDCVFLFFWREFLGVRARGWVSGGSVAVTFFCGGVVVLGVVSLFILFYIRGSGCLSPTPLLTFLTAVFSLLDQV